MGSIVTVEKLPTCDFCKLAGIDRPARFDFRTKDGRWANGCVEHYESMRASTMLGTGHGQLLMVRHVDTVATTIEFEDYLPH